MHFKRVFTLIAVAFVLLSGCLQSQEQHPDYVSHPEPLIYRCFETNTEQVAPILGEAISLTQQINYATNFCTFSGGKASQEPISDEGLLPVYASLDSGKFVAVSIGDRDSNDKIVNQIAAKLFLGEVSHGDQRRRNQFSQQLNQIAMLDEPAEAYAALLTELASVKSDLPKLKRQFIPTAGDGESWRGALWLWQETSTGQHLATLMGVSKWRSITIQALLTPTQTEPETQKEMLKLFDYLMEVE